MFDYPLVHLSIKHHQTYVHSLFVTIPVRYGSSSSQATRGSKLPRVNAPVREVASSITSTWRFDDLALYGIISSQ